ncbi:MAG: radical SAM protein [Myxococcota bacterium]
MCAQPRRGHTGETPALGNARRFRLAHGLQLRHAMLRALYIMPTERCNSRCTYCYIPDKASAIDANEDVFFQSLKEFLEGPRDEAPRQLRFIGGEPYLRPDLVLRLIDRFLDEERGGSVVINSNATLISPDVAESLASYGAQVTHIVSMDGLADVHDKKRKMLDGTSAHGRAVEGIDRLLGKGLPVYLNAVVDRKSVMRIGALMTFARERFGLSVLSVSLLQSTHAPMSLDDQYETLAFAYATAEALEMEITGHHRLLAGARLPGLRCHAGEQTLLVTGSGKLTACQRFLRKDEGALPMSISDRASGRRRLKVTSHACYTGQVEELATRLERLYRTQYPHYLEVSAADRVVFGTIR